MKGNPSYLLIVEQNNEPDSLSNLFMLDGFDRPIKAYQNTSEALKSLKASDNDYGWNVNLPDLILVDWSFEDQSVTELIKEVKSNKNFRIIPLIILSNQFTEKELKKLYQLGVNSCLIKPSNTQSLRELCSVIHQYWIHNILF